MIYNEIAFGDMAQLVERLVRNEEASGSNPLSSTKKYGWRLPSVFFVTLIVRTAELSAVTLILRYSVATPLTWGAANASRKLDGVRKLSCIAQEFAFLCINTKISAIFCVFK